MLTTEQTELALDLDPTLPLDAQPPIVAARQALEEAEREVAQSRRSPFKVTEIALAEREATVEACRTALVMLRERVSAALRETRRRGHQQRLGALVQELRRLAEVNHACLDYDEETRRLFPLSRDHMFFVDRTAQWYLGLVTREAVEQWAAALRRQGYLADA